MSDLPKDDDMTMVPLVEQDETTASTELEVLNSKGEETQANGSVGIQTDDTKEQEPQQPREEDLNPSLAQFMAACQAGDLETVKQKISSGEVQASDTFSDGVTGLHWAAINNRLSLVKYLMENEYSQADPNAIGGNLRATPFHWACRTGLVYVVDYFLTHTDADPTLKDSQNYNALHLAVHSSNITLCIYILLSCVATDDPMKRIYIDEPDSIKCTALHWASYQGDILTVNALLKYGADVNKVDKTQMTPLHWAFIRGYKSVLAALLEAGSDIFHKNDKNKDSFGVSQDMNCENTWLQVLREADRDQKNNWAPRTHLLEPKPAKVVTFLVPYVLLPIVLRLCNFGNGLAIPEIFVSGLLFGVGTLLTKMFLIPMYLPKDTSILKSPYLAGLFSGTAFWCIIVWIFAILPAVIFKRFVASVLVAASASLFSYTFFKAMFINPGQIPITTDSESVLKDVKELISLARFDTEHFCVNTFARRPLRSKFSRFSNRLIARFDHFCPWVYNDIGVRNHKLFLTFTYSLAVAIILFFILSIKFFDVAEHGLGYDSDIDEKCHLLSEDLCKGFYNNHFIFNLNIWCLFNLVWLGFLCTVQTFQVLKGLTTWEFSSLNNRVNNPMYNHSTVPSDFDGPRPPVESTLTMKRGHNHGLGVCCKLLGLDQFVMTVKLAVASLFRKTQLEAPGPLENLHIPTDFGWQQNWLDFWFIGDVTWRNLFYLPIEGENNLNGQIVDYYKLYEYPNAGAEHV